MLQVTFEDVNLKNKLFMKTCEQDTSKDSSLVSGGYV